jgi:VWFA-related protein
MGSRGALLFALFLPLQQPQLQEQITVERVIVDARVTDYNGNPITGLKPAEFRVKIDGKPATVESADWIADTAAQREIEETMESGGEAPPPVQPSVPSPAQRRGRLLIFFFQTDFARNEPRLRGQMKLLQLTDDWLDWIEPDDRVAVLSFDSHLKFRLDFTGDKRAIAAAMEQALYIDDPPWPQRVPLPSLGSRLKPAELLKIGSTERAFIEIGNALLNIPGPKSMILFGWGIGRYSREGVYMAPNYGIARQALEMARVSVFSIDFTEADSHSLAVGLGKVAADTGGFYASTFRFPHVAAERLQRTLAGHYELEVRTPPATRRGAHVIEVEVTRRGAYVLARSTYVDR